MKKTASQTSAKTSTNNRSSWQHLKRLGVFQLKLLADALRDLLLSPLSLIVTLLDLVESDPAKRHHFDRLMALGRRTERKIDLFEQHKDSDDGAVSIDQLVDQIEQVIKREYSEGQVSGKTKAVLDKAIGRLRKNAPEQTAAEQSDSPTSAAPGSKP
ncbi:MAG: hypothetical protein HWE11_06505 [Gammaproteobacteria bacterium]|nr:hypothetical protein [Gammaproteobacteria bacterium]